jgi:hypothetical protein
MKESRKAIKKETKKDRSKGIKKETKKQRKPEKFKNNKR